MSFDLIATHYRWIETLTFGKALQRARTCWLPNIPRPKNALVIGEGNGRFLRELLRAHPKIHIDCLDVSTRMLALAQRRASEMCSESCEVVRFVHEDVRSWVAQRSYDLVVTHFFLDCFRRDELKKIVTKLAEATTPNAIWLVADFAVPAGGRLARAHAKLWLRVMYWFFGVVSGISATELVDPSSYFKANGFNCVSCQISRARMVKSELWQRNVTRGKFSARGCRHVSFRLI